MVLGIQVHFILKELQKTIDKTNKVLDNADIITESVALPVSTLSSMIMGLKLFKQVTKLDTSFVAQYQ